ncbi:MAG: serine--tRNA ligase, partial [Bacteroidales bacterium]
MLTLKLITENPEMVIKALAKKHFDGATVIEKVIDIDKKRKTTQYELDATLNELKQLSAQIGGLMKEGKKEEAEKARAQVTEIKNGTKYTEAELKALEDELQNMLVTIPNLPSDQVPEGRHAEDNVVERMGGAVPELPTDALPHWE